jgi:hypothetical protein
VLTAETSRADDFDVGFVASNAAHWQEDAADTAASTDLGPQALHPCITFDVIDGGYKSELSMASLRPDRH